VLGSVCAIENIRSSAKNRACTDGIKQVVLVGKGLAEIVCFQADDFVDWDSLCDAC